jgi:hypothetical protein
MRQRHARLLPVVTVQNVPVVILLGRATLLLRCRKENSAEAPVTSSAQVEGWLWDRAQRFRDLGYEPQSDG